MIRYLKINEVIKIHARIIETYGGINGIREVNALKSALAQPKMTFDGIDLYPSIIEKACALGYSLIKNHPFIDGNKRVGHAAMEIFLFLNGYEISASIDEQEMIVWKVASGEITRDDFLVWSKDHYFELKS